jgi:pyruvate dehydrogenase E2 component (dihydrolipoamide acetyltransferase)
VVLKDELSALGKPVLVIWGADDRVIPAAHAEGAESFATAHVIGGPGHLVQMEQASDVNRLLAAHVAATEEV